MLKFHRTNFCSQSIIFIFRGKGQKTRKVLALGVRPTKKYFCFWKCGWQKKLHPFCCNFISILQEKKLLHIILYLQAVRSG